jgi:AhpD family alkylhydroperoxidase
MRWRSPPGWAPQRTDCRTRIRSARGAPARYPQQDDLEAPMALVSPVEPEHASPAVHAIYDDIKAVRKTDWINNFWKVLANDPVTLGRVWNAVKEVMAPGALDPLTKELVYIAVSVTNNCEYCIHSHAASATGKGMTPEMYHELMTVVALANETNRLANGYRIDVDPQFLQPLEPR